jgi:hypothetical protein
MQKLNRSLLLVSLAWLATSLAAGVAVAQDRQFPSEDWYGDVKRVLMIHYTGKTVRTKLPIPATRRGLELVDGAVRTVAEKDPPPLAAEMGEELTIKSFHVTDNNIEVLLARSEPPPKKKVPNPFNAWKQPRINLRFSRELAAKDLTIENINRALAPAVEVSTLTPPPDPAPQTAIMQATTPAPAAKPAEPSAPAKAETDAPMPQIVGDLAANPRVGELTVEVSTKQARVYIDGSYSGLAPRTVRLRAGLHTVLVVSEGYASWEQRMLIPGAKASILRVELRK